MNRAWGGSTKPACWDDDHRCVCVQCKRNQCCQARRKKMVHPPKKPCTKCGWRSCQCGPAPKNVVDKIKRWFK